MLPGLQGWVSSLGHQASSLGLSQTPLEQGHTLPRGQGGLQGTLALLWELPRGLAGFSGQPFLATVHGGTSRAHLQPGAVTLPLPSPPSFPAALPVGSREPCPLPCGTDHQALGTG